ncbi:MAG: AfsR/SARP family transcriptional regulator, partial [Candidatus Promineifilaceae bacterium]
MDRLSICWLGLPSIELNGVRLNFERRKGVALLAYLCVAGKAQTRAALATLLWPDIERRSALAYLRRTLWSLNQVLPAGFLICERKTIAIEPGKRDVIDVARFTQVDALIAAQRGIYSAEFLTQLEHTVAAYQGDFLKGFTLQDSSEFDNWQLLQTEHFRQIALRACQVLLNGVVAQRRPEKIQIVARQWLAIDPFAEPAHQTLLQLLLAEGRHDEALRQFEKYRKRLWQELHVEPNAAMVGLFHAPQRMPGGGGGQFRPNLTPPFAARPCPKLPVPIRTMFGREADLNTLNTLFEQPHRRLVTINGCGGIGKSTLARQFIHQAPDPLRQNIYYATLDDEQSSLLPALVHALGLAETSTEHELLAYLQSSQMLLVIDNLDLAYQPFRLVSKILATSPQVRLLITSRMRLNLREESILTLHGLESSQTPQGGSASDLFIEVAQQLTPHFGTDIASMLAIQSICKRLEGHPLAIELAAEWSRLFSLGEIASQLSENPDFLQSTLRNTSPHHRDLRTLFNRSWGGLSQSDRHSLTCLAIFKSAFDCDAAQAVAGVTVGEMLSLVDQSLLLKSAEQQFYIPAIYIPYLAEELAQTPQRQQKLALRHAVYYAKQLSTAVENVRRNDAMTAIEAMRRQTEHYLQAWRWQLAYGSQTQIIDCTKALSA